MNGYVLIKVIEYLLVIADSIPQEVGDAFLTQVEAICSHFGPSSLDFAHVRPVPSKSLNPLQSPSLAPRVSSRTLFLPFSRSLFSAAGGVSICVFISICINIRISINIHFRTPGRTAAQTLTLRGHRGEEDHGAATGRDEDYHRRYKGSR